MALSRKVNSSLACGGDDGNLDRNFSKENLGKKIGKNGEICSYSFLSFFFLRHESLIRAEGAANKCKPSTKRKKVYRYFPLENTIAYVIVPINKLEWVPLDSR